MGGDTVGRNIIMKEHKRQANTARKKHSLRSLHLSAMAPHKILAIRPNNGKHVYINPTVTAEYPICLAIVEPNVMDEAIPETVLTINHNMKKYNTSTSPKLRFYRFKSQLRRTNSKKKTNHLTNLNFSHVYRSPR